MGGADTCPSCSAFVRHDWSDKCGSCGADLYPQAEATEDVATVEPVDKADKLNVPVFLGISVLALLLCIGGLELVDSKGSHDRKTKVALASGTAALDDASTTLTTAVTTSSTVALVTTTTARPTTTTEAPLSDAEVMKRAADNWSRVKSYDFVTVTSGEDGSMTQDGSWDGTAGLLKAKVTAAGGPEMQMVCDLKKKVIYVKMPDDLVEDPAKPWSKVSGETDVNWRGASANDMRPWVGAATNVKKSGSSSVVDGVRVTRYSYDVDKNLVSKDTEGSGDFAKLIKQYPKSEFHGEVAIDRDGNFRQVKFMYGDGGPHDFEMSITIRNVNKASKVTLPPAAQISATPLKLDE